MIIFVRAIDLPWRIILKQEKLSKTILDRVISVAEQRQVLFHFTTQKAFPGIRG
jgi:hypothetical protein